MKKEKSVVFLLLVFGGREQAIWCRMPTAWKYPTPTRVQTTLPYFVLLVYKCIAQHLLCRKTFGWYTAM